MFDLKFNKRAPTRRDLNTIIEKRYEEFMKDTKRKITPELNVLNFSRTDLFAHVLSLFVRQNVHITLGLRIPQLLDFLIDVAERYTEAPYHTFYHAVDIVTMLYYFCHDLNANNYLNDLDVTFLMVAALCHDMGHPGSTNTFQINSKSDLAQRYNNGKSILETYSVDLAIELFKKHQITKQPKLYETIRKLILSTDMEYHGTLEKEAKTIDIHQDKLGFSRILLHAADISNMARPWIISKQWSDLIIREFYNQGDQEKKLNMTVSPGMDREICSQQQISLKFGEIILPFFESLVRILPKSCVLVNYLTSNRIEWDSLEQVKSKKRTIRRFSSNIQQPTTVIKRIRLGLTRSQSYPAVLYQDNNCTHSKQEPIKSSIETSYKNHLIPFIKFKNTSLFESTSSIETIVLYHPYDP